MEVYDTSVSGVLSSRDTCVRNKYDLLRTIISLFPEHLF